jgi:phosphoglycolate phosphatase-like HAD superfamily hydrolase
MITAAFAAGVRKALGSNAGLFHSITGFETGRKAELLAAVATDLAVYVTDTVADLRICQQLDVPTIAVTRGFDSAEDLSAAGATKVASNAGELEAALAAYHPNHLQLTMEN